MFIEPTANPQEKRVLGEDELLDLTEEFTAIVSEQLYKLGDSHAWLRGIRGMLASRIMLETVLHDVNICGKYLKNKYILDFGTGSGYVAFLLASLDYDVVGIDIDDFVEQESKETHGTMAYNQTVIWPILEKRCPNLVLKHYKNNIPYNDNSFDAVVAYAVLEHISDNDIPNVMEEIRRVLKPHGYLFISKLPRKLAYVEHLAKLLGMGHHARLYGDIEIDNLLKKYGFEILEKSFAEMFPAYPAKLVNALFPILRHVDKTLLHTPLKYAAHVIRIMSRKVP